METSPSDFNLMLNENKETLTTNVDRPNPVGRLFTAGTVVAATILCTSVAMLPLIPIAIYGLFTQSDPIEDLYSKMFRKQKKSDSSVPPRSLKAKLFNLSSLLLIAVLFQTEYNIPFYSVVTAFVIWNLFSILQFYKNTRSQNTRSQNTRSLMTELIYPAARGNK